MSSAVKVVIVEDDNDVLFLYQHRLHKDGFKVFTAKDGAEGLEVIERERPDIVLLDLLMPVMSGADMLARLRTKEWAGDIRVVILTNISKDEAPPALRFLHVDRYAVKAHHTPAQISDLVREVMGT